MSPARPRTSRAAIITAARELLEAGGLDAVSMAGVAARVGIRPPSLYKHFEDRIDLLGATATAVAFDLARTLDEAVTAAGPEPRERLFALADAYRAFARDAPNGSALLFSGMAPGAEPSAESQAAAARPLLAASRDLAGPDHVLAAARAVTAFAHGFTSIESAGAFRYGGDVDDAYRVGIRALLAGLEREDLAAPPSGPPRVP